MSLEPFNRMELLYTGSLNYLNKYTMENMKEKKLKEQEETI